MKGAWVVIARTQTNWKCAHNRRKDEEDCGSGLRTRFYTNFACLTFSTLQDMGRGLDERLKQDRNEQLERDLKAHKDDL